MDCFFGARPESVAKSDHFSRFCGSAGVVASGSKNLVSIATYDVANDLSFVPLRLVFHFVACMVVLSSSVLYIECTLYSWVQISACTHQRINLQNFPIVPSLTQGEHLLNPQLKGIA